MSSFLDMSYHVNDPGELLKEGIITQVAGAASSGGFLTFGKKMEEPKPTFKLVKKDLASLEKFIQHLEHVDRAGIQAEIDQMK